MTIDEFEIMAKTITEHEQIYNDINRNIIIYLSNKFKTAELAYNGKSSKYFLSHISFIIHGGYEIDNDDKNYLLELLKKANLQDDYITFIFTFGNKRKILVEELMNTFDLIPIDIIDYRSQYYIFKIPSNMFNDLYTLSKMLIK